jgi:hypothetical protein
MKKNQQQRQLRKQNTTKAAEKCTPTPQAGADRPRFIPWHESDKHPAIERYIALADIALRKK